jgi:hypothetical protein
MLVAPTSWFPKGSAAAERLTAGPLGVPVPMRVMDCGLSPVLSVMTREPPRVPVVVGAKVTVIAQDALAARVAAQVFKAVKSTLVEALMAAMLMMFKESLPTLVRVTC